MYWGDSLKKLFILLCLCFGVSFFWPSCALECTTHLDDAVSVYIENSALLTPVYQMAIENYEQQPSYLKKNCYGIHFMDSESLKTSYQETSSGKTNTSPNQLVAYSNPQNNHIYLEDNSVSTISHELWHLYDFTYHVTATSATFQTLYEQHQKELTAYAQTNIKEFFAEAGDIYVNQPELLQEELPDIYEFFQSLPKD